MTIKGIVIAEETAGIEHCGRLLSSRFKIHIEMIQCFCANEGIMGFHLICEYS